MDQILSAYKKFLRISGEQYRLATTKHNISCKRGCHECCSTGFFDITLLDALYLREALARVAATIRKRILAKASEQLDILEREKIFSHGDPLLRSVSAINALARRSRDMSCPALDVTGKCLIYVHRPHICRMFGPTIRGYHRKIWLKGCRHFTKEIQEEDIGMADQYVEEIRMKNELYRKAGRRRTHDIDTIIPAALVLDLRNWL